MNLGLHWSSNQDSKPKQMGNIDIEDHWVYPIVSIPLNERECKEDPRQYPLCDVLHDDGGDVMQRDIFRSFRAHNVTVSVSLRISREITVNLYQPCIRPLFSFAKSFADSSRTDFLPIHASKRFGYSQYRQRHGSLPNPLRRQDRHQIKNRLIKIIGGLWICSVSIHQISVHFWYRNNTIPSNAITFSMSSFQLCGEVDKIRKKEDIDGEAAWKMDLLPNFVALNEHTLYFIDNGKLSINGVEIRTTRNKQMEQTLRDLNPMGAKMKGHIVICEIYENERRYGGKWSKQLLPTERPKWSSVDGHPLDMEKDFALPKDWVWVTTWDWKWSTLLLDHGARMGPALKKYHSDDQGWQYSFDFTKNTKWTAKSSMNSHTRRRRWIRIRRYGHDLDSMQSARDRFRVKNLQPMVLYSACSSFNSSC